MGLNVVQKILKQHIVEGELAAGKPVAVKVDQTLTQDATGTMADLEFEQMGADRSKVDLAVSYIDHKTVQMGFEDPDDHKYLQTFAAKYGEFYSRSGNGICHQVQVERFGKPGTILLGSDSHTPTGGGIGQIAIGVGGMDVAAAMAGMPFYLTCPKVVGIHLTGNLPPFVTAKDIILRVLQILTTQGNVGWAAEYFGPGVETLSVPERATITNMGAELGVTTSVFPSDNTTRKWLKSQHREVDWKEIVPDPDATYDKVIEINMDELEPMVAQPHSPGNVVKIREIEGMVVDQVCIGSCTNSSYKDGRIVAEILDGRHAHPNIQLVYVPGSKQVFRMGADEGWLSKIIAAGAVLAQPSCSFCIGIGYAPKSDGISVRTNNRNFFGRSGTLSGTIYLVSPETAAATAITGVLTDPRDLKEKFSIEYPQFELPEYFHVDDSSVITPPLDGSEVELYRGPNIKEAPLAEPLPSEIKAEATIKVGDKITTDHISPAGTRLKYRSNVPEYANYVFETLDPSFPQRALEIKEKGEYTVIVAGDSYGQGSSREHAALCPMYLGVKAVVAKAIERIHKANLINFGILPLIYKNPDDYDKIDQEDKLTLKDTRKALIEDKGEIIMTDETKNIDIPLVYELSDRDRKLILTGGVMGFAKAYPGKGFKEVEITE